MHLAALHAGKHTRQITDGYASILIERNVAQTIQNVRLAKVKHWEVLSLHKLAALIQAVEAVRDDLQDCRKV